MTTTTFQYLKALGASVEAIQHHYDLSNEFYHLWLDSTMTYTCAIWDKTQKNETLESAQLRKIDYHATLAQVENASRVLDVGCGWGGALKRFVEFHGVKQAVGLTLSQSQVDWINQSPHPQIQIILESWLDHNPTQPYDAIISVEAFEAFAKSGLSLREKLYVYRTFFEKCHQWLKPRGWLSLQTIAYGNTRPEDLDDFIANDIFPESDLPRLSEIATSVECLFEIVTLQNDRLDYVDTLKDWRCRLRQNRQQAIKLIGEEKVIKYERYLMLSAYMFASGNCDLYRIAFRRIDNPRQQAIKLINF